MSNPPKPRRPSFGLEEALQPDDDAEAGMDLSGFEPKPALERPPLEQIRKTSEAASFPSREALSSTPTAARTPPTPLVQLNTKIPLDVDADIATLMQRTGWRKVDTIKRAVATLKLFSDIANAAGLDLERTIKEAAETARRG